eukprot:3734496-Pleurochrysis_carterae.AAC.1
MPCLAVAPLSSNLRHTRGAERGGRGMDAMMSSVIICETCTLARACYGTCWAWLPHRRLSMRCASFSRGRELMHSAIGKFWVCKRLPRACVRMIGCIICMHVRTWPCWTAQNLKAQHEYAALETHLRTKNCPTHFQETAAPASILKVIKLSCLPCAGLSCCSHRLPLTEAEHDMHSTIATKCLPSYTT